MGRGRAGGRLGRRGLGDAVSDSPPDRGDPTADGGRGGGAARAGGGAGAAGARPACRPGPLPPGAAPPPGSPAARLGPEHRRPPLPLPAAGVTSPKASCTSSPGSSGGRALQLTRSALARIGPLPQFWGLRVLHRQARAGREKETQLMLDPEAGDLDPAQPSFELEEGRPVV